MWSEELPGGRRGDEANRASEDAAKYSGANLKSKSLSRGWARDVLRQVTVELRLQPARATMLPSLRLVAVVEEQRLSIDRFRWIDENQPIRELGA